MEVNLSVKLRNALLDFIGVNYCGANSAHVYFPHKTGVVINIGCKFGTNCTVYQGCTIGAKDTVTPGVPEFGDNVIVYANSTIIGPIKIGNNVIIGANSFVDKDIPDNFIYRGGK